MTHKEGSPLTFEELKQLDEQYVVQTYSRNPIAIDHGQGATLYPIFSWPRSYAPAPAWRRLSLPTQGQRVTRAW